jgi:hypothetical protein
MLISFLFNIDISRKDDLFNLFFLLVYWAGGTLPWFSFIKRNEATMNKYEFVKSVNDLKI